MRENIHIELNGKKVGCMADKKKKQVYVDARSSDYNGIKTVSVGNEAFEVIYTISESNNSGYCGTCGNYDDICYCH